MIPNLQKIVRTQWLSLGIIIAFFVLHIAYINTPFVNHEYNYRQGSQFFLTQNEELLDDYFQWQANPLTYSYFSSMIVTVLGDHYASYRILALLGGTLLLIILLNRYRNPYLLMIVGLNPLIWIYSGRSHSELLSAGLVFLALDMRRNYVFSGVLAGLAACVKYHAILVSGGYWAFIWLRDQIREGKIILRNRNFISGLVSVGFLAIFFLLYKKWFGFWILPENFSSGYFKLGITNWLNNYYSYSLYLSGMFFLTIPFHLQKVSLKWQLSCLAISIPLAILNQNLGEMLFGGLNPILSREVILLIKIVGFWNFMLCISHFWKREDSRVILYTILLFIGILSLGRPVQRYLIFVVPFWAILVHLNMIINKYYKWIYVLILCTLNLFATVYQVESATASNEIAQWAIQEKLFIDSGYIHPHVGNFPYHKDGSDLLVVNKTNSGQIVFYTKSVKVFGYPLQQYYVVPRQ